MTRARGRKTIPPARLRTWTPRARRDPTRPPLRAPPRSWLLHVLLVLLVLAHLVPLWTFAWFPSQDGPVHLSNARILLEYRAPPPNVLPGYFVINRQFDPNWSGHLLLAALMAALPPLWAEKVLISAILLLLPAAFLWLVRCFHGRAALAVALVLPWLLSYPLHMGFYNFCLGIPAGCLVIGFWARHREDFTYRPMAWFTALTLVTYFCHPFALAMAGLAIAVTAAWTLSTGPRDGALRQRLDSHLLRPAYAALPAALLFALFLVKQGLRTARDAAPPPFAERLFPPEALVSFVACEADPARLLALLVVLGLAAALVLRARAPRRLETGDGLLLAAVAAAALYSQTPDWVAGGGFMGPRYSLWLFLLLSAWLAAQRLPGWLQWILGGGAAACAVAQLALLFPAYAEIDREVTELLSITDTIPENATMHPLVLARFGKQPDGAPASIRVKPLFHAGSHVAARRRVVSFDNYEAWQGYFPVNFRPTRNPAVHLGVDNGLELDPPRLDLLGYERTGGRVDYVLTFGEPEAPCDPLVRAQLDQGYRLVRTSQPRGLARLYQRVP